MNIYIGNLSRDVNEQELSAEFEVFGQVTSAKVIKEPESGISRGFGFIEMPDNSEADAAIKALNGKQIKGQRLKISEAYSRSDKRKRGTGKGPGDRRGSRGSNNFGTYRGSGPYRGSGLYRGDGPYRGGGSGR